MAHSEHPAENFSGQEGVALLPDDERTEVVATVEAIGPGAADSDGLVELPYRLFAARAVVGTG
jgi:hypothetical protein